MGDVQAACADSAIVRSAPGAVDDLRPSGVIGRGRCTKLGGFNINENLLDAALWLIPRRFYN